MRFPSASLRTDNFKAEVSGVVPEPISMAFMGSAFAGVVSYCVRKPAKEDDAAARRVRGAGRVGERESADRAAQAPDVARAHRGKPQW